LVCGHTAVTLARHLKAAHEITADVYRAQHPGARIRSEACEANRSAATAKAHAAHSRTGKKKLVACPCGTAHEVGLTFASKDLRCPVCKARDEDAKWATLTKGEQYVTCSECGHRAENLTSHIQNAHPEWVGRYPGQIVASTSAVRDNSALRGRTLSEETRAKMSASAGWNRGLTKETDERVAHAAEAMRGRPAWSKGLTKETHPSLRQTSEKLMTWAGPARYWSNGLRADLSDVDFTPYLDETGALDRKTMAEELDLSEPTVTKYMESITKYMESIGLRLSTKYVDARAERDTIRLEKEELLKFALLNGKIVVGQAMVGLGRDYKVIKRECARHELPTFNRRIRQTICLDAVSKALAGVAFEQEWEAMRFTNPSSGRRFRFDGYFPTHDLIVEFHGYQHWTFPSVYIKKEELYFALQGRDRIKENLIHGDPTLRYFVIREDEPYADPTYLRARLIDEGVLDPGK
jgi:Zn ribbon nucleic-acid-binding protein